MRLSEVKMVESFKSMNKRKRSDSEVSLRWSEIPQYLHNSEFYDDLIYLPKQSCKNHPDKLTGRPGAFAVHSATLEVALYAQRANDLRFGSCHGWCSLIPVYFLQHHHRSITLRRHGAQWTNMRQVFDSSLAAHIKCTLVLAIRNKLRTIMFLISITERIVTHSTQYIGVYIAHQRHVLKLLRQRLVFEAEISIVVTLVLGQPNQRVSQLARGEGVGVDK